ncbi:TetR/AcrR family transcriptional regulator [Pseudonocardia spinosispora]|uniref:TetR/AcrR family transcriptional regulator n=1 Tax=Pseudonocardia spinosispora TaxID=103441 RepID=UPI0004025B0E|nr:TetR/AcrR family transcriptional regulator [Pseudonocardia spinosispora]
MDGQLTPGARKVLDAASTLFYERGIHAIGVDTIAKAAGVTKKTLYDRFGSKDQIIVAYLRDREQRWRTFLADHLAAVPEERRLLGIFEASARWAAEYSPRGCSFINARAELPDPEHPAFAIIDESKAFMLARFAEHAGTRAGHDPVELAESLFILHEGALVTGGLGSVPDAWPRAIRAAEQMINAD